MSHPPDKEIYQQLQAALAEARAALAAGTEEVPDAA